MTDQPLKCVHCERNSYEVPLVALRYQDTEAWICPQHLPILIHKPQMLTGKLPGVENLVSEGHDHH
jgi:hypothetical protein